MRLVHFLAAGCLVLGVTALGSGCGNEGQQATTAPPAAANTPPGGGSQKEYMDQMNRIKGGQGGAMGRPGGAGAPGGK